MGCKKFSVAAISASRSQRGNKQNFNLGLRGASKSKWKVVITEAKSIPLIYTHACMTTHSPGLIQTSISMQSGGVKLVF